MPGEHRILIGKDSNVGKVRTLNEDSFGIPELHQVTEQAQQKRGKLIAVADGIGGHTAGEVASHLAIDVLFDTYYGSTEPSLASSLEKAFAEANKQVHSKSASDASKTRMGTTLVAAVVKDNRLYVANVGDSRAYWIHRGQIEQVTRDHSWVADQMRAGVLTKEQAARHMYKSIITRAIGNQPTVKTDLFSKRLESNDALVLCSDGLSNNVTPDEIQKIVTSVSNPQDVVEQLIKLANERGGDDNITAIVLQVSGASNKLEPIQIFAIGMGLIVLALLGFFIMTMLFSLTHDLFQATPSSIVTATGAPVIIPKITPYP